MSNSIHQKIASGILWRFGERFLAQGVSLVVSIVLARFLLPEEYGLVSIVLVFIAFADVLATGGLAAALIQKRNAKHIDFDTVFICSLLLSIGIYIILFFLAPLIAQLYNMPELTLVLRVFAIRIIIGAYNSVQHAFVSRHMIFKKFFLSTLFGTIISGIVGVALAINGFGVWALVVQYLSNTVIDSIVLTITISWRPKLQFSKDSAKSLLSYGWKVLAANFSGTFFSRLKVILVGKFYPPAELAFYEKGSQLSSTVIDNSSTAIMDVLFPAMSDENGNQTKVKDLTARALEVTSFFIFPFAFGLCAVARPLVLFLFTDTWSGTIIFLQLLSIAAAISLVSNISLQTIKATGRSDILLKIEFIKKPVYMLLLLGSLRFGASAVAISEIIYAVYGAFVNAYSMGKIINYPVSAQLKKISPNAILGFIVGAIMFTVTFLDFSPMATLLIQFIIGGGLLLCYSVIAKPQVFVRAKTSLKGFIRKNNERF